ncbi:MAG TPA: hypothetical protein DCE55_29340 [Planctomycetaceae bacterium]|nr:hypothetical protein [Planctomycetaceae bacterium]|tara:strand:- start:7649 stop:8221 length:573 start_codon:yes stop_codon:yes gene_type:complete
MNIVGIDPSLSGSAVIVGEGNKYYTRGFSKGKRALPEELSARFKVYEDLVARVCEFIQPYYPHKIYIEHYAFMAQSRSVSMLYEYGALLRWNLMDIATVVEVNIMHLKKFATGKSGTNVKKSIVAAELARRYNVSFQSDDFYDAFALYQIGLMANGITVATNQAQRDVMEKLGVKLADVVQEREEQELPF